MTDKALMPLKAKAQEDDERQAWFAGRIPRRLLAIPFGGPIPSAKSSRGVDLDGEFFTERTDIFGPYPELRKNRERLTDFHHSAKPPGNGYGDPTGMMRGTFIGKSILDPNPEEDGWWVDFWFAAGEKRVGLIAKLAERGAQLFGSSQPLGGVAKAANGEITVWPYWLQTISPSPQNTYSVIRPKAALDALAADPDRFWSGIEESLRSLGRSLRESSDDRALIEAKAGRVFSAANETDILAALDDFEAASQRVRAVLARQTIPKEEPDEPGTG